MRHRKKINHLGRTSSHRKAMLANMASSLILYKRISTTTAKAKALKTYVEPLITKAKQDNTHSRRMVFSYLQNKIAVSELFRDVVEKVGDRPGGYTRILKTGNRNGDNAEMCFLELVDYNETYTSSAEEKKTPSRRRRRRRGGKKKSPSQQEAQESPASQSEEGPQVQSRDTDEEQSVSEEKQDITGQEGAEEQQQKDESVEAQQKDSGEERQNKGGADQQDSGSEEEKKDE
ncbi:MAG: 50S ribosomal protein L17 [Bacteroidales bacterium]|nr:50S ribosomal protein L17 [Bacteroidales bacterium]